jgi:hypothetical protein
MKPLYVVGATQANVFVLCEVYNLGKPPMDKINKLAKYKGLLDSGAITQQEYDYEEKTAFGAVNVREYEIKKQDYISITNNSDNYRNCANSK